MESASRLNSKELYSDEEALVRQSLHDAFAGYSMNKSLTTSNCHCSLQHNVNNAIESRCHTYFHREVGPMCSTGPVLSKLKIECSYGSEYTPEHDREKCLTLLYGPKSEKFDAIMNILAELNGLTMGEDIIGVSMYFEYSAYL